MEETNTAAIADSLLIEDNAPAQEEVNADELAHTLTGN